MKIQIETKKIFIFFFVLLLILAGAFWFNFSAKEKESLQLPTGQAKITVFYSPTCPCCKEYLSYLRRNGFQVEEKKTQNMLSIKEQYQIPQDLESCHTSAIGDYFVEGHMPVEIIKKLLEEKPEIDGIALPGMPQGSPGMPGFKAGKWTIYSISDGQPSEFTTF